MDKYAVRLYSHAVRDLEEIYTYIKNNIQEPDTAANLLDILEKAILSFEYFPERGSFRKYGVFAGKKYRQLIVKNYSIVYKLDTEEKVVLVVAVRNMMSEF